MSSLPSWLAKLAKRATLQMHAMDLLAPIGCHSYYNEHSDQWEVTLFASSTEVIGGQFDGKRNASKFAVDLRALFDLFSKVHHFEWQALPMGDDDELGAHISIEGSFEGHSVWFRFLAQAPRRFESGRYIITDELRLEDVW